MTGTCGRSSVEGGSAAEVDRVGIRKEEEADKENCNKKKYIINYQFISTNNT